MAGAGAAAVSFAVMEPGLVRGSAANSKINLGLIGCGGRGTWIAKLFKQHGGYNIVAVADYFQDRVDDAGKQLEVPEANRFTGLKGYLKLLEKVDAVAIISPPYFHPEQAAAAVEAGKHVYLAKPIAVDVPGCQSIGDSGKKATAQKRCFLVDFQTRADPFYMEALRRVHEEKALGEFAFGEATYHAGDPFTSKYKYWQNDQGSAENRLRAWGLDKVLSGDIITEQNIHTLDVMNWIMGEPPLWAVGTGGRKFRPVGTCYDTFSVLFQYPNNVGITFSSRQSDGYGTQPDGIRNRMFGTEGILETEYGGTGHHSRQGQAFLSRRVVAEHLRGRRRRQYQDLPRERHGRQVRQSDRRAERAQQPDHDPRPDRRLRQAHGHLGRAAQEQREARRQPQRREGLKAGRRHMIDREISRRQMLATTAGTVAGLTLAASGLSFGQEKQARRSRERRRAFGSGVCDWTIGKRCDPAAFALAKKIGLDGVQVDFGGGPDKDPPLFNAELQSRYAEEVKAQNMRIASLAMGVLNEVAYKSDPAPRSGWTRPSTWPRRCGSGSSCWPSSARAISRTTPPAPTPW